MAFRKMNEDIKGKWVKALRSGDYDQGQGQLKDNSTWGGTQVSYCCLGVLQELIEPEKMDGNEGFPTNSCLKKAGLPALKNRRNGPSRGGILSALINMNDEEHADFDEIANFIEQNL